MFVAQLLILVWPQCHCDYDHSAVKAILDKPESNGKHARWWLKVFGSGINQLKAR